MIAYCASRCAYCQFPIVSGQRWVREKIYDPAVDGRDASYLRYHSEPFAGRRKLLGEAPNLQEIARTTYAA